MGFIGADLGAIEPFCVLTRRAPQVRENCPTVRNHGTADAETVRSSCICVFDTYAGALYGSRTALVFVHGDFVLERGPKKGRWRAPVLGL